MARCTIARLMHRAGLRGAVRGRALKTATCPDTATLRPPDLVTRRFAAGRPNELSAADLTYVATWVIHRRGPWKGIEEMEFATLEWVAWYNTRRLLEPLGYTGAVHSRRPQRSCALYASSCILS